jgi:hypothetical protein
MAINEKVSQDQWPDYFVSFSNGNRGRSVSLEVFDPEAGGSGVRSQGKLIGVDYDPAGKGDDIIVTTGEDEIAYSHTIQGPVEVWQAQHENGQVGALEIVDQNNSKTVLSFGV